MEVAGNLICFMLGGVLGFGVFYYIFLRRFEDIQSRFVDLKVKFHALSNVISSWQNVRP